MFSAKETPWYRIGKVTEEALTSAEAIVEAELDWEVELRGMYTDEVFMGGRTKIWKYQMLMQQ